MTNTPQPAPKAIALFYDGNNAPTLTAKGDLDVAEEIIRIAKENDVPIFENKELISLLSTLELGDEIPELLYLAIAEVIVFAYKVRAYVAAQESGQPFDWDQALDQNEIT
ncbi:MAG: flagellar biosynthesis protein FlhB [Gammaproteobacteria bacterium]|nr:MAG: flagellar biosynthesis protein FlhB [Gammaproteobacteria bacterium]